MITTPQDEPAVPQPSQSRSVLTPKVPLLCIAVAFLGCWDAVARGELPAEGWWQWRGPSRTGQTSMAETPWPDSLQEEHLQPRWQQKLDPSYSGPIVSQDQVFVTATQDKAQEVVKALDRKTGALVWEQHWDGALTVPFFAAANGSWIRATPAFDGENLYVAGMRDVLVCLNGKTGEIRWKVDFVERFQSPLPSFGFVSSPLIDGDRLYVQAGASVVCLEKATGNVVWRSLQDDGGMSGSAFSSPVLTELLGQRQLLVQTRTALAGLDPDQGTVLWSHDIPAYQGMNILTPTVVQDALFTSSYGGQTILLRPTKLPDATFRVEEAWRNKLQGYMSSPIIWQGHAYLHLRNQRFACVDLATGKETWITKPFGKYWSMVSQGGRILALDEAGDLLLIAADPQEFRLIDRRTLTSSPAWAHLAVLGDEVYVRDLESITAYQWK